MQYIYIYLLRSYSSIDWALSLLVIRPFMYNEMASFMSTYAIIMDDCLIVLMVFCFFGKLKMNIPNGALHRYDTGLAPLTKAGELCSEMLGDG